MRPQTTKSDTGPYKRQELLKFLEEQGKNEKDWEQNKPYIKEEHCKGKVWVPPQIEQPEENSQAYKQVSSDWDEILEGASEADIVELASILGFASMVNQSQYNAAQQKMEGFDFGGWSSAAKAEPLKFVAPEPDNSTDVDESIRQLKENDSSLTSLNLNNIKVRLFSQIWGNNQQNKRKFLIIWFVYRIFQSKSWIKFSRHWRRTLIWKL